MGFERNGDGVSESVPVDGERRSRRHLALIGGAQDQRPAAPHLFVQQADRIAHRVIGAQGIGAHQLGEFSGLMGIGLARGSHFVQHDRHIGLGYLPCRLGACEAAADDVDGGHLIFGNYQCNVSICSRNFAYCSGKCQC